MRIVTVPLTPNQAFAVGVLAEQYQGRTQTLAVERHVHTGRVTVRVAGLDYELTEDGDAVLITGKDAPTQEATPCP